MITYRELKSEEVADVMLALDSAYKTPLSEQMKDEYSKYIEKLATLACNFAAFDDNRPVGYIAFYKNDHENKYAFITQVIVDRNSRGLGVGKGLLDCCKNTSVNDGFIGVKLEVKRKNTNAQKFYKHYGFEFEKEIESGLIYKYDF